MTGDIRTSAEVAEEYALPRRFETHSDPEAGCDAPEQLVPKPVESKSPAEWAYERLIIYIQNFEKQLDAEHEVAIGLTGSEVGVLRIEGMGYFDPDIVTFYGTDTDGLKTQLIQHVSQLNVMLRALPRAPDAPVHRIGFRLAADLEKQARAEPAED
ncbi:hypothetical protein ATO6_00280 [Oceanicola sp. 22II-s10i]|uniref:DUF6173 family protein n=1 Tax=Oceanicola sp. 22II-s10i TaxID=1317116 RepID=UPI000B528389|nr:DUF6173 family protein [Oceanicola sp. 22II-s10i]OWU85432.1 hypothetical protein ATO6_00280 [Oceanicola sp. 22II-s10i]